MSSGITPIADESAEELFEQAPCGYLATRPSGEIVRVNETFLTMAGLTREAIAGMRFQHLLTAPGQIYYETHVAPLLQMQGFVREIAFDLKTKTGRGNLPVVLNCVQKKGPEGRPVLLRITLFDASDRRQYERELLAARRIADDATQTERYAREEAERANRTKDDFLALVSHELRTPLSAILGWVQVLRRKLTGDADVEHSLSVIERNTRLQTRLVDDLLDLSRMASGKMRLDVQRVNLADVIEAALETAGPGANARLVRIQKILDPEIVVSGDPGRLQQVFWNLLSNAVKFTPKDGFVRVIMERVKSHIEVSIIDSGQGMSADFLQHAFERFRQSGKAHSRETGGLGLGLALVKYLVEMHGGTIVAHSDGEGRGSTFVVKLPVVVVEQAGEAERIHPRSAVSAKQAEPAVSLAGIKVLLVDDERDAREALWHNLSHRGAEVTAVGSVREALDNIERISPDVLISDIGMPDEDGYELIRRVRLLGERGRIPAVALTAYSRLEDRTRALMAGYQAHLAKPVDIDELAITLASVVGRLSPATTH